jgi:hypothetical protein
MLKPTPMTRSRAAHRRSAAAAGLALVLAVAVAGSAAAAVGTDGEFKAFLTQVKMGNYPLQIATPTPASLEKVADVMPSALFRAYGARATSSLHAAAPLVTDQAALHRRCTPTS